MRENHSLGAEVINLLRQAMEPAATEPEDLLERINRRRRYLEREKGRFPASVDLLREDRAR